jgi:hypothetical protein
MKFWLFTIFLLFAAAFGWWQSQTILKVYDALAGLQKSGAAEGKVADGSGQVSGGAPSGSQSSDQPPQLDPRAYLPESVYMLRQRVSFEANGRLEMLQAGMQVKKIGGNPEKYLVEAAGGIRTVIDATMLTRDPAQITAYYKNIESAKATSKTQIQSQIEEIDRKIKSLQVEASDIVKKQKEVQVSGVGKTGGRIGTNLEFVQNEISRLQQQKTDLMRRNVSSSQPGT